MRKALKAKWRKACLELIEEYSGGKKLYQCPLCVVAKEEFDTFSEKKRAALDGEECSVCLWVLFEKCGYKGCNGYHQTLRVNRIPRLKRWLRRLDA